MESTILIDQDRLGFDIFIEERLAETGWDLLIQFQFRRPRDYGLPANLPDQEIWRFAQAHHLLLVTANRNSDDTTSLQATLRRENTPDALPVITIARKESLKQRDYRQRLVLRLAEIIVDLDDNLGTGRLYVP